MKIAVIIHESSVDIPMGNWGSWVATNTNSLLSNFLQTIIQTTNTHGDRDDWLVYEAKNNISLFIIGVNIYNEVIDFIKFTHDKVQLVESKRVTQVSDFYNLGVWGSI